jgi:hypothetical protein
VLLVQKMRVPDRNQLPDQKVRRASVLALLVSTIGLLGWLATHQPDHVLTTLGQWYGMGERLMRAGVARLAHLSAGNPRTCLTAEDLKNWVAREMSARAATSGALQSYSQAENPKALAQCIDWHASGPNTMLRGYGVATSAKATGAKALRSMAIASCHDAEEVPRSGCECILIHQNGEFAAAELANFLARLAPACKPNGA